jgi:hypothetical protein
MGTENLPPLTLAPIKNMSLCLLFKLKADLSEADMKKKTMLKDIKAF